MSSFGFLKRAAIAVAAIGVGLAAAEAWGQPSPNDYGPLRGYIQFPGLVPNGTTNAQPACHVERRYLCKIGNGSCTGRSCRANETRVQVGGVNLYCDRFVC